ncbi:MAG TPA: L-threonylcarbamoyladenylate synthase [Muribaculum sp.]|jgi:L-threonylcarbamoyladenylate synthase|uniref:L-threonylcarbamoyladenylate synthase n=1 Tax=Heminiphilus faecis TaxID=2601703 RepID=A0ABV4CSN4_9BACT|nr:L-threonylcarbamoyladenylate synthase [Heminiphilus faecis]RLT77591.1 threonylcarbamoyl-AMP synthase [bacterium J10(2018)]HRF67911.1 L-threonylcarbamoyladenylate synthase [Muribaculum sp.]
MSTEQDLQQACEAIKEGKVILYPTDTVWGIGCDATDRKAVRRVYEIKRRVDTKAMLVLTHSIDVAKMIASVSPEAESLLLASGRPTTVVLPDACGIAPELVADDGSVGVRITSEAFSSELCRLSGVPLVSTSANISGAPSAAAFDEIDDIIKNSVDYICVTRRDDSGGALPSRVVKVDVDNSIKVLRD